MFLFGNMVKNASQKKIAAGKRLNKKSKCVHLQFFCGLHNVIYWFQTYQNHLPNRLTWPNWTWHICQVWKTCCPACWCHHIGYSVPPAHHRTYHLTPKHLPATWPRPEQSHLLPEACSSPNGTDKRRQSQQQTERPPPDPCSDILKRRHALYDDKLRYLEENKKKYKKKLSKIYCL